MRLEMLLCLGFIIQCPVAYSHSIVGESLRSDVQFGLFFLQQGDCLRVLLLFVKCIRLLNRYENQRILRNFQQKRLDSIFTEQQKLLNRTGEPVRETLPNLIERRGLSSFLQCI